MNTTFPIIKHPATESALPILVSIPHYGTESLPNMTEGDYSEPWFSTFAYGFADTFVGDLYSDLHHQGATVLATPLSRIFVDVNRRRDDFTEEDGFVRSKRGVVRTHTIRDAAIFTEPLHPTQLETRLATFYDPYYDALDTMLAPPTRDTWLRAPPRQPYWKPPSHARSPGNHRHPTRRHLSCVTRSSD